MSVRQYIGARYVPVFANPIQWSNENAYEPLTIVLNKGNSYTSKQYVPTGIDIENEDFWALTGNYNAQVEQYRQEVEAFDGRITQNTNAITDVENDLNEFKTDVKQHRVVIFGDSWTDFSAVGDWSEVFGNVVKNCTFYNFGVSGATITTGLMNQVAMSTTPDNSKVDICIIVMGVNDASMGGSNPTDYTNALNSAVSAIQTKYPNARILFAPNICSATSEWKTRYINAIKSANLYRLNTSSYECAVAKTPVFFGWRNVYQKDGVHLTQNGADLFGMFLASQLGFVEYSYDDFNISTSASGSNINASLNLIKTGNNVMFSGSLTGTLTLNDAYLTLPQEAIDNVLQYCIYSNPLKKPVINSVTKEVIGYVEFYNGNSFTLHVALTSVPSAGQNAVF